MERVYQICTRCIMDTTDPEITFDEQGICRYCHMYETQIRAAIRPDATALQHLVDDIRTHGRDHEYDCIIGVSGGVDSTYVAYIVKKLGLRPLAVHMDNGWDSELAVSNIEKTLKTLNIDLYTHVLDWEEFRDIQLAFLRASVSDGEIPTDHAIAGVLLREAAKRNISYIISGTNSATEAILPRSWTYGITDWIYIRDIHRRFGSIPMRTFPICSYFDRFYYSVIKRIQTVRILDFIDYNKAEALRVLQEELGWQYYGGKHYESIYTRFFQGYILPKKFNIDKRRAHFSNLICSNQMTLEQALQEIEYPTYSGILQEEDLDYVLKKFDLTEQEFDSIMNLPIKTHRNYTTIEPWEKRMYELKLPELARRLGVMPTRGNNG